MKIILKSFIELFSKCCYIYIYTLALILSLYELKMLALSANMAEKQNPSRTWYISLTVYDASWKIYYFQLNRVVIFIAGLCL